ncbi:MGMT family protein [Pseudomonas mangrovi]|uniref:DNA base-flipping protein YbaZ n=1 Tax=Pseudomonas mangrovi TaxID=2161748 RepID=A0A2T5PEQ9_9PSED|nr:MGMT family protein [Pseudomonas mangrovi]PTU76225.1 DNA base-flipping protein YbaZ [Pseudomonas mangrovi]
MNNAPVQDCSGPEKDLRRAALFATLAGIPAGKVVAYGQLAELAGLGRAARWVGRTLAQLPEGSTLPWHRVLRADGRPGLPADSPAGLEQLARLREEGISLDNRRVDMRRHGWHPEVGKG